jgi:hypothetical protein
MGSLICVRAHRLLHYGYYYVRRNKNLAVTMSEFKNESPQVSK